MRQDGETQHAGNGVSDAARFTVVWSGWQGDGEAMAADSRMRALRYPWYQGLVREGYREKHRAARRQNNPGVSRSASSAR